MKNKETTLRIELTGVDAVCEKMKQAEAKIIHLLVKYALIKGKYKIIK